MKDRREYFKKYRSENKEKIRQWLIDNKEQQKEYHREYHRAYYLANKEKIDRKNKLYAQTHRKEMVKNVRKYQMKNIEKHSNYNRSYNVSLSGYYRRYIYSAKKRGYGMELSLSDFSQIIELPCYYCGEDEKLRGIDRKDNNFGYTKDNSVPCCTACNMMKKILTVDDFFSHVKNIYEYQKFNNKI